MWQTYETPTTVDEVLRLLADHGKDSRIVAGGTDLMVELRRNASRGLALIDVTRLGREDRVWLDGDNRIHVGSAATHNQVAASGLLADRGMPLALASSQVGTPQVRNRGTVAGNLVTASPANDTITALWALDARLTLRSVRGQRTLSFPEFYRGVRTTAIARDEMVTDISFPALGGQQRGIFIKRGLRRANAISVVNAAAVLTFEGERVTRAAITLGSVAPIIIRASEAEKALLGAPLSAERIAEAALLSAQAAVPIADVRGSAEYRRAAAGFLVRRALAALREGDPQAAIPGAAPKLWGRTDGRFPAQRGTALRHSNGGPEPIECTVNGEHVAVRGANGKRLLDMLREDLGLTGAKEGCGEGECGACTVWMDGIAVLACLVPAPRAHGTHIVTIEGMARGDVLHPLQQAFIDEGAVQCGYCTPGIVMAGSSLLEEAPLPEHEQIIAGLSGNLCRCTGYYSVVRALERANGRVPRNPESSLTHVIGKSVPRVDARAKVTGEAKYPGDLKMEGMLHARILFAGRPHARILNIDTSAAEAAEGVAAVLTARDVPVNERGLQIPDQPVLCGPGSTRQDADVVMFVGDQVAVVVAETEDAATLARDLIRVEYEDLPALTDPFEALKPEAPQLHSRRYTSELHPELCTEGNLISHHQIRKGDMDAGWKRADVVVEAEYHTPSQEHAYLQPEAGLAYIDEQGRVTVVAAGQWASEDQHQIARALALPLDKVRVVYPAIGGAFGGREDPSVQVVLALAAWKLRRPVKIVWSREESIAGHCKRHPVWIRSKWGATRGGKLVAADVKIVADGGAYCYTTNKVLGNTTATCAGPYDIPNFKADIDGVYTNNPPSGAFRGFGSPQAIFAAEMQMNKLAQALGMDPLELRLKNLLREGSLTAMATPLPDGVSLAEVTEQCARSAGWTKAGRGWRRPAFQNSGSPVRRGTGLATALKNVGYSFGYADNCRVKVTLSGGDAIDEAVVYIGSAEVGQGTHTVISQMAAEALGVPLERVRLIVSDTASSPRSSGSVSASRMTLMSGNAVRGACAKALQSWRAGERPAVAEFTYQAPGTTPFDRETGRGTPNFSYGYVSAAVEAEVDTDSGEVRILRVFCADDVGKAINPQQVMGQIEGSVVQAAGWVTCENFVTARGRLLTPNLSTYLIPTSADIPGQVDSIIMETPSSIGPWGARGMGEMPFIALAPAIIAAVHDATGIWFDEFPLTAERVWKGLSQLKAGKQESG